MAEKLTAGYAGRFIIDPDGIIIVLTGYQLGIITHAKFGNATHMKT